MRKHVNREKENIQLLLIRVNIIVIRLNTDYTQDVPYQGINHNLDVIIPPVQTN